MWPQVYEMTVNLGLRDQADLFWTAASGMLNDVAVGAFTENRTKIPVIQNWIFLKAVFKTQIFKCLKWKLTFLPRMYTAIQVGFFSL